MNSVSGIYLKTYYNRRLLKALYNLLSEKSIIFHSFQNYNMVCFVALRPKSTANVMS